MLEQQAMLPELRAVAPTQKEIAQITSDEGIYNHYIDALMLIHDHVVEYSNTHEQPRFATPERERRLRDVMDDEKIVGVRPNLMMNLRIASQIRQEAQTPVHSSLSHLIEEKATLFVDGLLSIYKTCRTLKRH